MNSGFALVESYAPSLLNHLRKEFTDYQARFEPSGIVLGNEVPRVDAAGCVAALQVSLAVCSRAIQEGQRLMRKSRRSVLAASVLTAVSSAGLMTVVAADAPKVAEYAIAVVALIGACATIIAQHNSHGVGGGQIDVAYRSLAELLPTILSTHARLTSYLKLEEWSPETADAVKTLTTEGHSLCSKVQSAAVIVGVVALAEFEVQVIAAAVPDRNVMFEQPPPSRLQGLKPIDPPAPVPSGQ